VNPGDIISRYRILARIGQGGMGVVYRAEDLRLERQVALKFLPRDGFTERSKTRFLNEARTAAKVRHPNICPIYDIEEADGEVFLVMAHLTGDTLHRKISWQTLDPARTIHVAEQVASGLAAAHEIGIVHRDIKSSNIMIDSDWHVSILDFGLALAPNVQRLTHQGTSVGTPAYMSPEQIQGGEVDSRSDLWSLGVMMFEMLTGTLPFRRDQSAALIHAVLNDPVPAISIARRSVPPELREIIVKALEKDPAKRWQSAREMAIQLKRLGGGSGFQEPELSVTHTMAVPSAAVKLPRLGWAGVAAAVLAVGAGFGIYYFKAPRGQATAEPPAIVLPAARHVAVLPFQVSANDETTRTLADGLVEVLTEALSNAAPSQAAITTVPLSELLARKVTTPSEALRVDGANLALTGSAETKGDVVEFTVNLVDTASLKSIRSQAFVYDPKNPLVSKNQAVAVVARMMDVDLPDAVRSAVTAGDTAAPDAYSSYLEGRGFLTRHDTRGNIDRAIQSFKTATGQDPKYALAYAGLGEAYWRKAAATGDKQWATLAYQNAEYAEQLDSKLAVVHSTLGLVYLDAGRKADALKEFQKAMDLAPSSAEAIEQLADVYDKQGRFQEAEDLYLRATQARPTDWYGFVLLGIFYYERERYTESEAAFNKAKVLTPDNDLVRIDLGGVYRNHGRYKEAIEEYKQALRIHSSPGNYAGLGGAYFFEHRFKEAVAALETAIDLDPQTYRYWGNLGIYAKWSPGDEAKSEPALRKAIELAMKVEQNVKSDLSVHANLAEYHARLKESKTALEEIDHIPPASRAPFTARLAIVYELTGHRDRAIRVIRENLKSPDTLNQIKDDPDLASVWRDGKF
jgi:serine/threonine-protein kinase